ncbi:MAG TPA: UDP-N-acetylmuramate dehydrogenase [Actinomycetota bacterium]|nr:UDP-N-acetylmuramate dehydrogenase [Actinomycetota bacterium]
MTGDLELAEAILRARCGDRVRTGFPMAALTTFRIGGPAALFLQAESSEDLAAVAEAVRGAGIGFAAVGKGSNILVSDEGFRGLVLRLGRGFRWTSRDGDRLASGASMPLPALAGVALTHGLAGLEWGVAIPASFGGAVRMNAGAHGGELSTLLETIELYDMALGEPVTVKAEDAGFAYRASALPREGVVIAAQLRLSPGDREAIRARMDDIREWRRRHQPLAEPNCGSVFKNPPGDFAARLVDEAGLKGTAVGGATVSRKHANFIVTSEGTHAADVVSLIRTVQERVSERFSIHLEPEVHLVGEFDRVPH